MIVLLFLNVFKNFVLHARIKDIESRYQFIRNLVEHILLELCFYLLKISMHVCLQNLLTTFILYVLERPLVCAKEIDYLP